MARIYADHPFQLLPTPTYQLRNGEKADEFINAATQMACAHNVMLRSLNAIYLQAPHISAEQQHSFLQFTELWYKGVEHHHRTEDDIFFPILEDMTGEKGIMGVNTEQHDAFLPDLQVMVGYVRRCLAGSAQYDGAELVRLIDAFAPALREHLADEIPTFVALNEWGEKLKGFHARFALEAQKTELELGILAGAVFLMATHDVEYEGGIHKNFPPIPAPVVWGLRNVAWWAHRDWWAFAPCDRAGKMRPLDVPVSEA
ncbi:hemerythrin HHE cation binding domain-containing protein [Hypoxylon crocopeplum]|nr:hemerythrin HHE cation binding domain-containing protein [Hypoxylon crocopeplum]